MSVKTRIVQYIEDKGISKYQFYKDTGIANGFLDKDGNIGSDKCEVIYSQYPDMSLEWLITGLGNMYKSNLDIEIDLESHVNSDSSSKLENQDIPIYDIHAAAGLKMLFNGEKQNIIDSIRIPNMSKCDGAMFITGDSMYPLMKSGDIVLFKQIHNIDYLHYGDIYILSYDINGDEYLVIKYIQRSELNGHIKLVSYNKHHEAIDIPLEAIKVIALVKANVRYNTMQ